MNPAATVDWPILDRWDLGRRIADAERGCVLVGPAGAGKSTAARDALTDRETGGERSSPVVITGVEGLSMIPFGALSMAEMSDLHTRGETTGGGSAGHDPARREAGWNDRAGTSEAAGDDDLVHRLRRWLAALRRASSPVIIDDPHALDLDSATMLADEMRRGLIAVMTHRPSEPAPAVLAAVLDELALPTIEVEPFDRSMVELAIEQAIGAEPVAEAVDHLVALSAGNPMLLREIVRDLSARGAWTERRGRVSIAADANPSDRMAELLRSRYPSDPDARRLLELVAHAGSIPDALVRSIATSETRVGLLDAGWLAEAGDGTHITIPHPLLRQFVREATTDDRLVDLLREALATPGTAELPDPDSRLMALRWALVAGIDVDPSVLRWARVEAARRFDRELAVQIADRLSRDEPTLDTLLELTLALAQAERYDDAVAVLVGARTDLGEGPAPARRHDVVEIGRFLLRFAGPLARLKRWGTTAPGVDRTTAAWADAALGTTAFSTLLDAFEALAAGDLPEARARADAVRAAGFDELGGDADEVTMLASLYGGDEVEALGAFDRLGARLADPGYRHPKAVVIDAAASSLLMLAGRFEQAYAFDRQVHDVARSQRDLERAREMTGHLGMTALFLGRVDAAIEAFDRHRDFPAAPSSLGSLYLAGLAQALALGGRLNEAERVADDADRQRAVVSPMMLTDFDNLLAMTQHLLGHHDVAEERMRSALALAAEWRNSRGELMALHGLARMGRATEADVELGEARQARGLRDAAHGFSLGVLGMVDAVALQDPRRMADAAGSFASTGMGLGAAEGYAAACRMATTAGAAPPSDVERWRAELVQWLDRCSGLRGQTVLVERAVDALTEREREVAALAAGGLSNATIAERLRVSVRTVENTLHRTFTKLGVATRDELADAFL